MGYAPYRFSVHKGWLPEKKFKYPAFRRKISKDLPMSNFSIQVQYLDEIIGKDMEISIDDYVKNYLMKGAMDNFNARILSVKEFEVDGISAKDVVLEYLLTVKGLTREVKSRAIVFIINNYVYTFSIGTFEKDYEMASKEFELMVKSFHFIKE